MTLSIEELATFLVKAKRSAYAGDGREVPPERRGFQELEFKDGQLEYRDSHTGFDVFGGQEVVRYFGTPVWTMQYFGGMSLEHFADVDLSTKTFSFLKQALLRVDVSRPFRGPLSFEEGDLAYEDYSEGDIPRFTGTETILKDDEEI